MQVAIPMLACGLGLAQHGGSRTSPQQPVSQRTGPQGTIGQQALPVTGAAIHTSAFLSGPRTYTPAPRNGAPHQQHRGEPVKNAHQPHREPFPYGSGGSTAVIPFAYGFPVAYGGNYLDEPADAAQQPQPEQADNHHPPNTEDGPEGPASQGAANTDAPRFRPLYLRPMDQGPITFAPVLPQPATTLIFNDGRPRVQVHNYALTPGTLYALDGESRQEIPLSMLNVPATIAVNRAAGIDFALPRTP
jgi:hypothetical protein